jgi:hypothetical protein
MNCIHGIDSRFCAACNRSATVKSPGGAGSASLADVLTFLNHEQVRATCSAVAEALGVGARSVGGSLGPHRPEASWIVSAENGLPAGYDPSEWHPALLSRGEIIATGRELLLRMSIGSRGATR